MSATVGSAPLTNGEGDKQQGLNANDNIKRFTAPSRTRSPTSEDALFHPKTRAFVYGMQTKVCTLKSIASGTEKLIWWTIGCTRNVRFRFYQQALNTFSSGYHLPIRWSIRLKNVLGNLRDASTSIPKCRESIPKAPRSRHSGQLCQ